MVSGGNDVRHLVVETLHAVRRPLPHLLAGLVEHRSVAHYVLVLLHEVARAQHRLDVKVVDVVGTPCRGKFENGLVDVVFHVALGVAQQNHGEGVGIGELLSVSPVLRCRGK